MIYDGDLQRKWAGIVQLGIIWIPFCVCIFLAWYFIHKAKHKERLLALEKNLLPVESRNTGQWKPALLTIGIVIIGLSIGLGIIPVLTAVGIHDGLTPLCVLGLGGGLGLVVANRIQQKG